MKHANPTLEDRWKQDREFIARPDDWPRWPFLPMKRDHSKYPDSSFGVLCVTAKPVPPVIYHANVWHMDKELSEYSKIEYSSLEAMQKDVWFVD